METVREQMSKILSSSHLPHAFLFSGPKGLGKTSAARILAKAINCETKDQRPSTNDQLGPCNECEACKSITNGSALDLIEIDGASNRGIDDIRALRETIKLTPSRLKYKVYVIDEAHMLTKEAFNALLKTLEEPSAHAIFVLATTEPEKIPETIISRCIQIKFKKATIKEMIRSLERIVEGEKLEINDSALKLIVQNTDGSFRDAAKLLEQLSFESKKITLKQAENLINQSGQFDLLKWLSLVLAKDVKESLFLLSEAIEEGIDLRWLVVKSLEKLRDYLFYRQGVVVDFGDKEEKWRQQVDKMNIEAGSLISLMKLLDKAGVGLKNAQVPGLPLQLAIVEFAYRRRLKVPTFGSGNSTRLIRPCSKPDPSVGRQGSRLKVEEREEKEGEEGKEEIKKKEGEERRFGPETHQPLVEKSVTTRIRKTKISLKDVKDNWEKFLKMLRPHNSSIEALLRSARPLKLEGGFLTIEVFYQFHKDRLGDEKCLKIMETVLEKLFGEPVKVKCVLGKKIRSQRPDTRGQRSEASEEKDIIKNAEEIFMS